MKYASNVFDFDSTLGVGEYVTSWATTKPYIFKIKSIERRFVKTEDLSGYRSYRFKNRQVGDEYSPIITLELVMDISHNLLAKKPRDRKWCPKTDGAFVKRLERTKLQYIATDLDQILQQLP